MYQIESAPLRVPEYRTTANARNLQYHTSEPRVGSLKPTELRPRPGSTTHIHTHTQAQVPKQFDPNCRVPTKPGRLLLYFILYRKGIHQKCLLFSGFPSGAKLPNLPRPRCCPPLRSQQLPRCPPPLPVFLISNGHPAYHGPTRRSR